MIYKEVNKFFSRPEASRYGDANTPAMFLSEANRVAQEPPIDFRARQVYTGDPDTMPGKSADIFGLNGGVSDQSSRSPPPQGTTQDKAG